MLEKNIEVVEALLEFLTKHPGLRFNQALHILYKGDFTENLGFYQSPEVTLKLFKEVDNLIEKYDY